MLLIGIYMVFGNSLIELQLLLVPTYQDMVKDDKSMNKK